MDPESSEPPAHPTRRRELSRWLKVAGWLVVIVIGLSIGALAAAHSPAGRRFVLSKVTALLASRQISLTASELRYNLFDLSFELRNLQVRSTSRPDLPVFAAIARVRVDLGLLPLLRGRCVVQDGEVDALALHYVTDARGNNLPVPPASPGSPQDGDPDAAPIDYFIYRLAVSNASVRYEDQPQGLDVMLPVDRLDIEGEITTGRHNLTLTAAPGQLRAAERVIDVERLAARANLGQNDVAVNELDIAVTGVAGTIRGAVRDFSAPQLDLSADLVLDVARAASLADVPDPVAGTAQIAARVEGPAATPRVAVDLAGDDLAYRTLAGMQLQLSGSYDLATQVGAVSSLALSSPFGSASADGVIAAMETAGSRLNLALDSLDAAQVMRAFSSSQVVGTRITGRLRAEWPGLAYERSSASGSFVLAATAAAPGVVPTSGRLDLESRNGNAVVRMASLTSVGSQVDGRVLLSAARELGGELDVRVADIGSTLRSIDVVRGTDSALGGTEVSGPVSAFVTLAGSLSAPRATAEVTAPAVQIGSAAPASLDASLAYAPDAVDVHRVDIAWQDARAHAEGRVGLTPAQALDLRMTADAIELAQLLRAAGQERPDATGRLSLTAVVGGRLESPVAAVSLQGADIVAYREVLGSLTANAMVAGTDVTLESLTLDKPQPDGNGSLMLTGRYDTGLRTYAFDVSSDDLRILSAALPNGQRVTGTLEISGQGRGTVDAPQADFDVVLNDVELDSRMLGRVSIDGRVADGSAVIRTTADRFRTRADATIATASPFPASLSLEVDGLELESLPLQLDTPLTGEVHATVEAMGALSEPAGATVTATLDSVQASWNDRPFGLEMPAVIRYAAERLYIDRLVVSAQDSTVTIEGELPVAARTGEGTITLDAHVNLATLAQYAPSGTEVTADGTLTVSGTLSGNASLIIPQIEIALDNGLVLSREFEPGISNLTLRATVGDGRATVEELSAAWGAARLQLMGVVPFQALPPLPVALPRADGPIVVDASVADLDPATIPGAPEGLGGRVGLEAHVEATSADLETVAGEIRFPSLALVFNGLTLEQADTSMVRIANGAARLERLALAGTVGKLSVDGTVGLAGERPLDVRASGQFEAGVASVFVDGLQAQGQATVEMAAAGTVAAPDLSGFFALDDGTMVLDSPNVAANGIWARVDFHGREAILSQLIAELNGGSLTGWGSVTLGDDVISSLDIGLNTDDFAFDAPLDLRSLSDANLTITRRGDEFLVQGAIVIEEGGLTGDINFDTGLMAALSARRTIDLTEERNPLLERVRFDVGVETVTPLLVENNLAQAEVEADLRVLGTPYETGLSGRLTLLEGGEVVLNERRYQIERGGLTFIDERRIAPVFDLRLTTTAQNYDVTLTVTGPLANTETALVSDPALPEPDIMALLVTGRTLNDMRGEEYEVAREQVLSYLTGRVGSTLGRGIERATGLSTVRLEPNLIANEADPSARLTVGQDLADGLTLVYSTALANANDQIWTARYDLTRRFQTRAVRQSDNSYRFDIRHDVRFGGRPAPRRLPRQRRFVSDISVTADKALSEQRLRSLLDVEVGDEFDFFAARSGAQRIEQELADRGFLQARVRLRRRIEDNRVLLTLEVAEGPQVDVRFAGTTPPARVRNDVRRQWMRGVFDIQRVDDGREVVEEWLMGEGYLQRMVEASVEDPAEGRRLVTFTINPGPRYSRVRLVFEGVAGVPAATLEDIVRSGGLERDLFTDPVVVTELLERYYREQGYLTAEVDEPRFEFDAPNARIILDVREGPQFMVRDVRVAGARAIAEEMLLQDLPVAPGEPFLPVAAENALNRIRDMYWSRGYNDARPNFDLTLLPAGRVDVAFAVNEGPRTIVSGIQIEGREKTAEKLVADEIEVVDQQPLDLGALSRSRQNLYNTGAFSLVDVTRTDVGPSPTPDGDVRPVTLNVAVREVQPFQVRYGVSFDTERGPGGIFDVSAHNVLGRARVFGLQSRYDARLEEMRLFLSQPTLRTWPIQTTATAYVRNESNPETDLTDAFDIDRRGFSLQQERRLRNNYVWTYGFRYERVLTSNVLLAGQPTGTVSPLTATLTRETRDEILDASTGSFLSHAFAFSPAWFGVDEPFWKYAGQYFHYFPLRPAIRERFTNRIIRPRLVFATGARIGISRGVGGEVPRTERFFAGGSTTLRGFAQNAVGPIGADRLPAGGNLLFVLNNELRFPLVSVFDGVGFVDVGNSFSRITDFSFTDLRQAVGVGLRVRTPWFLLRGDYGIALDPRPGESRSRFFFSIGQAF